jgi:hypothetical protein
MLAGVEICAGLNVNAAPIYVSHCDGRHSKQVP